MTIQSKIITKVAVVIPLCHKTPNSQNFNAFYINLDISFCILNLIFMRWPALDPNTAHVNKNSLNNQIN